MLISNDSILAVTYPTSKPIFSEQISFKTSRVLMLNSRSPRYFIPIPYREDTFIFFPGSKDIRSTKRQVITFEVLIIKHFGSISPCRNHLSREIIAGTMLDHNVRFPEILITGSRKGSTGKMFLPSRVISSTIRIILLHVFQCDRRNIAKSFGT